MKQKADQLLETSKSYQKQNSDDINDVCIIVSSLVLESLTFLNVALIKVTKTYPIVNKYQNHWPVRDMLKLYLKYTSELSRKGKKKAKDQ